MAETDLSPTIGDNNPPEPTPLETMAEAVNDLYFEAQNWLDGDPVSTAEQAAELTRLKSRLQEAVKAVDAERKKVADPVYATWKDINAAWKPIGDKATKAVQVAQRALTPWLEAVAAENKRKADEAREAANEAARRLREAATAERQSSDLRDVDRREELEREAEDAAKAARRAEKETSVIRGEDGSKATLRTIWNVTIADRRALLMHYLRTDPDWIEALLLDRAQKDVRAGARFLEGCLITSEQRAI